MAPVSIQRCEIHKQNRQPGSLCADLTTLAEPSRTALTTRPSRPFGQAHRLRSRPWEAVASEPPWQLPHNGAVLL